MRCKRMAEGRHALLLSFANVIAFLRSPEDAVLRDFLLQRAKAAARTGHDPQKGERVLFSAIRRAQKGGPIGEIGE